MDSKFKVLSLFSGIGGLDLGFGGDVTVHKGSIASMDWIEMESSTKDFVNLKRTPFKTVFQNDIIDGAKQVCVMNGIASNYHVRSIVDLIEEDFLFPYADVVIGGFPCQPFSMCGNRKGFSDERGTLYKSFVTVVQRTKPKVFVAENVCGILTMEGNPIQQIVDDFSDLGYNVKYQVVKSNEFGVPQTRKRVIIMGILKSVEEQLPELPDDWNVISENRIQCHIGKYFEHLAEPNASSDVSQMLYSGTKKLLKGQGQTAVKMSSPAMTVRAEHHGQIEFRRHANNPEQKPERRLTVREVGLIQTFSPDFQFVINGTMAQPYRFIGNAVPPLLGYIIARKVERIIGKYFTARSSPSSAVLPASSSD